VLVSTSRRIWFKVSARHPGAGVCVAELAWLNHLYTTATGTIHHLMNAVKAKEKPKEQVRDLPNMPEQWASLYC